MFWLINNKTFLFYTLNVERVTMLVFLFESNSTDSLQKLTIHTGKFMLKFKDFSRPFQSVNYDFHALHAYENYIFTH